MDSGSGIGLAFPVVPAFATTVITIEIVVTG
jgi:hypothetical protein